MGGSQTNGMGYHLAQIGFGYLIQAHKTYVLE